MGQILHKLARTTEITRKEIQNSTKGVSELARLYNVSRDTIYRWKNDKDTADKSTRPHKTRTVLTELDEKIICEFRKKTLLPLDDIFIALKNEIPAISRSNIHRLLQRNGISQLPKDEKTTKKEKFKEYSLGFVHIDTTEIRIGKDKLYIFVAIERNSKFVFAKIYNQKTIENSIAFLQLLIEKIPFKIHRILTDNGIEFTYNLLIKCNKKHAFDEICEQNNIIHKLTQFRHPWTNGQVEITNKMIKNATTRKYFYSSSEQFEQHLVLFLESYNYAKRLKSLKFSTPYQKLVEFYKTDPSLFKIDILSVGNVMGCNN